MRQLVYEHRNTTMTVTQTAPPGVIVEMTGIGTGVVADEAVVLNRQQVMDLIMWLHEWLRQ